MAYCHCEPIYVHRRLDTMSRNERVVFRTAQRMVRHRDDRGLSSDKLRRRLETNNDHMPTFEECVAALAGNDLFEIVPHVNDIVVREDTDILKLKITG